MAAILTLDVLVAQGLRADVNNLKVRQLGVTTDTEELWIGWPGGARLIGSFHLAIDVTLTPSAGPELGGRATVVKERVFAPSAGPELGGQADVDHPDNFNTIGGFEVGGQAAVVKERVFAPSGGMELGGQATAAKDRAFATSAGTELGGKATTAHERTLAPTGGFELGGKATAFREISRSPIAGIELGGQADVIEEHSSPLDVLNVDSPGGDYVYGDTNSVAIEVTFSDVVTVTGGPPELALANGQNASYTGGSGTDTLTFTYSIATGFDTLDLDYLDDTPLNMNGGTIELPGSVPINETFPTPGDPGSLSYNRDIEIDTTKPSITSILGSPDGSYTTGQDITITVFFDEDLSVSGTPSLTLNNGATVNYDSMLAGNAFNFVYTVGTSEDITDLDVTSFSGSALDDSNPPNYTDWTIPGGNNLADNANIDIVGT